MMLISLAGLSAIPKYLYEAADVDDEGYIDGLTANLAIEKLEELNERGQPFFLGVGFVRPHVPFYAPQKWLDLFPLEKIELPPVLADDLLDVEGDAALAGKALGKDAAAGKETFLSLMGVERAREQAHMLVAQAKAHLHGYGAEADLLRAIADYIVERDR